MTHVLSRTTTLAAIIFLSAAAAEARDLTIEDRINAQEAIERVYYTHQIGGTRPFEEAVPRAVLEKKVRTYLRQSVALQAIWKTPVTPEMLRRELERMARQTRMPERLRELYAVLGNDPFLIQETLARPALVDRLVRSFFASDATLHAKALREAEAIHEDLAQGRLDPWSDRAGRSVVDMMRADDLGGKRGLERRERSSAARKADPSRLELPAEAFDRYRDRLPDRVGEIGPVREEREHLVIPVILSLAKARITVANFVVPKISWDEWWASVESRFDEVSVDAVARGDDPLPSLDDTCLAYDTWNNGSLDDTPDPRYLHTAVWTGSFMIVWGGFDGEHVSTGGRYDPATDTWLPTSTTNAPSGRSYHTAVWTGSLMVIWGGYTGDSNLGDGGRYDPVTDAWAPTTPTDAPSGRYFHAAVWTGSHMILWGGYTGASNLGDGGRYDPVTDTWTPMSTTNAPSARNGHSAVWAGSRMVVWGGYGLDYSNTGGRYDPATDTWAPTSTTNAPPGRYYHTAVWTGSRMVVWGGLLGNYTNTGGRYDPVNDTWSPTSTGNAPEARAYHTAVWTGSRMVVWGGSVSGSYVDTGSRYDPASDTWSPTSTTNAPSGRIFHAAVWTGNLMVVWSGQGSQGVITGTGGRYNPATDTWTPTSITGAPSARSSDTAIWTGSLMIIWGGYDGSSRLDTGGRYDPAIDAWTPTSMTGAPVGRAYHTAVWTGSLMVVWGGSGASVLDTGGRYDPASDTWTPTSTTNAPSARHEHAAVWTGSLMIVWGGDNANNLNTGGRYDPAADTWAPTSTTNAPSGRFSHTAVWTGSLMVVWGGSDVYYLNTGGRYDPATDTWAPTSTTNAPERRIDHTAVWTGSLMVVWGGGYGEDCGNYCDGDYCCFVYPFNTGGRYNPTTDTWTPTSTTNAPEGRAHHTVIWTGSLMVVWGGVYDLAVLGDGGRYSPLTDSWTATSTTGAPSARGFHTAVWTGSLMVVWGGGNGSSNNGGRYIVDPLVDDDGDGFSECRDCNDNNSAMYPGAPEICDGLDNDCNGGVDGIATSCGLGQCASTGFCTAGLDSCVPGSPSAEVCDGADNNCDGTVDNRPVPTGSPDVTMVLFGTTAVLGWGPLSEATGYDVVRGSLGVLRSTGGDFPSAILGCLADDLVESALVLSDSPASGTGFFYLVRGTNCGGPGTYDEEAGQVGSRNPGIALSSLRCP